GRRLLPACIGPPGQRVSTPTESPARAQAATSVLRRDCGQEGETTMSSRQLDAPSPHRQPGHAPRLAGDVGSGAAPWIRSPGRRAVADGYTIDDSCFPIDPRVLSDRPTRAFRSAFYTRYSHRRDAF